MIFSSLLIVWIVLLVLLIFECVKDKFFGKCPSCGRRSVFTTREYTGKDLSNPRLIHHLRTWQCRRCSYQMEHDEIHNAF
jgi:hypothetical protein